MIFRLILVILIIVLFEICAEAHTSGTDEYMLNALGPLLKPLNGLVFDGPASISNAPTTKNRNKLPKLKQLQFYNYYSAAMYYGYGLKNMTCEYCLKFSGDVDQYRSNL